jgi:hypothetical protein
MRTRILQGVTGILLAGATLASGSAGKAKIPASVAQAGTAAGEFTVNGQTFPLKFAWAEVQPDSFTPGQTGFRLILSDVPWDPNDFGYSNKVDAGTLHAVVLSIGSLKQVDGSMLHHKAFKDGMSPMSSAGGPLHLEVQSFGPDVLAGRVTLEAPQDSPGGTFYYAAAFKAALPRKK